MNTASGIGQLVECPRCGERFELSETFRAHFEEEKRNEVAKAVREHAARIRAEAVKDSQAKLAETEQQVTDLKAQVEAEKEAQEKREAEIRAEAEKANEAILAKSQQEVENLQEKLKAGEEAQEKREAEIRAETEEGATQKLALEREQHAIEKKRLEQQMADMQRQLGQKSAELQGEALEVYLKRQLTD